MMVKSNLDLSGFSVFDRPISGAEGVTLTDAELRLDIAVSAMFRENMATVL
jgi:hypothetical protein